MTSASGSGGSITDIDITDRRATARVIDGAANDDRHRDVPEIDAMRD